MKLAAVLVPVATFLLLPWIMSFIWAIWIKRTSKDAFRGPRPITSSERRKLNIIICLYMYIFAGTVSWSVYVFSHNVWLSAVIGLAWVLPVSIMMPIMSRRVSKALQPPPGGWPDEKARLDAFNKWQAEREEREYKKIEKLKWWIVGWILIPLVLVIILVILCVTLG
ncbi:MAG: hypothetical protein WC562_09065 [Dehalococcoidia bacterium]